MAKKKTYDQYINDLLAGVELPTDEQIKDDTYRANMSATLKGRKKSTSSVEKSRQWKIGKKKGPRDTNTVEKISSKMKEYEKTPEHCKNISLAKKGKPNLSKGCVLKETTCPHCGKTGGGGSMKRWHFDNCNKKG